METVSLILMSPFLMIRSAPSQLFLWVERALRRNASFGSNFDLTHVYVVPMTRVSPVSTQEEMDNDTRRLESLRRIVRTSRKKRVKTLWRAKVAEYENHLRWKRLTLSAGASERRATT